MRQANVVRKELREAATEFYARNRQEYLHEMIDVIHAAVGVLHKSKFKYTSAEVSKAIADTIAKNEKRGYYHHG